MKKVKVVVNPVLSIHSINPPITKSETRMMSLEDIKRCIFNNAKISIVGPNGRLRIVNNKNVDEVFDYVAKYTVQESKPVEPPVVDPEPPVEPPTEPELPTEEPEVVAMVDEEEVDIEVAVEEPAEEVEPEKVKSSKNKKSKSE